MLLSPLQCRATTRNKLRLVENAGLSSQRRRHDERRVRDVAPTQSCCLIAIDQSALSEGTVALAARLVGASVARSTCGRTPAGRSECLKKTCSAAARPQRPLPS